MVVLDGTIVNIALPSAQQALHFSNSDRQWIVTAYALAFGSLVLFGGRLGDLFGRKRTFVIGLVGFAVVSAVGGSAQSFAVLVSARTLQGGFGALLAPAALSILTTTFTDPRDRGTAFAVYGGIAGAGGAIGLLLGGALTEYLSWRWCLYVNLAIALPTVFGATVLLVNQRPASTPRIDIPGTLAASGGLFALVFGFSEASTHGWASAITLGCLVAAVVLMGTFVAIEGRVAHPLLPLGIVTDRNRGGSYLAVLLAAAGMFGVFLFITYYLQRTRGYTPLSTGLAFLPMVAALIITSAVANTQLLPRVGPKPLIPLGMVLAACGLVIFTQLGLDSAYAGHVLPGLVLVGLGLGLVMPPAMNTATAGVAPADAGAASATANAGQQIGGAIGTSLLNTMFATAVSSYLAGKVPSASLAAHATLHGYTTAFWWSIGIFLTGGVICGLLLRPGAPRLVLAAEPAVA